MATKDAIIALNWFPHNAVAIDLLLFLFGEYSDNKEITNGITPAKPNPAMNLNIAKILIVGANAWPNVPTQKNITVIIKTRLMPNLLDMILQTRTPNKEPNSDKLPTYPSWSQFRSVHSLKSIGIIEPYAGAAYPVKVIKKNAQNNQVCIKFTIFS